jgi:hypothetical protein
MPTSPEQDERIRGDQESRMTEEERDLEQLKRFLAHAAGSPELRTRLRGVDPYEVMEITATEGFHFGLFTLHRSFCTGYVMPHFR